MEFGLDSALSFGSKVGKVQFSLVFPNLLHPTPPASAMLPKFDPNKVKVIYLRCTSGEVCLGPQDQTPGSVSGKGWVQYQQSHWILEGLENHGQADHPEPAGSLRWCFPPPSSSSKPSGASPRQEEAEKQTAAISLHDDMMSTWPAR